MGKEQVWRESTETGQGDSWAGDWDKCISFQKLKN